MARVVVSQDGSRAEMLSRYTLWARSHLYGWWTLLGGGRLRDR